MTKRRGSGEGSVYLKDGKWIAAITVRSLANRQRRITRTAKSKRHAKLLLDELRLEHRGISPPGASMRVSDLIPTWLKAIKDVKARGTIARHRGNLKLRILPFLGHCRLSDLTSFHIEEWHREISNHTQANRKTSHYTLSAALSYAVKHGLIPSNPCRIAEAPRSDNKEKETFSLEEQATILKETQLHRLHAMYVLAFHRGMRQGEIFGLRWEDVNFDECLISVKEQVTEVDGEIELGPLKTSGSVRSFAMGQVVFESLHQRRVDAMKRGEAGNSLVFPNERGNPIRRSNHHKVWTKILEKLKMKHRGMHCCRHTAISTMLSHGEPLHIVSKTVGSSPATILKHYAHMIQGDSEASAARMDDIFRKCLASS